MRDRELYARILGVTKPWRVVEVEVRDEEEVIEVFLEHSGKKLGCPECGKKCSGYDHRRRSFRHLDTCQLKTVLTADIPRVKCSEHGVRQIPVPWAEPGSRFTAMFESVAIDWLQETSIKAVARRLRLSWDEVDGIKSRAVARGLERRKAEPLEHIAVDETSFQKRHEYVTVVSDSGREGRVLYVGDGRGQDPLDDFFWSTDLDHLLTLRSVSMDMHAPYIAAVRDHVPEPDEKICFDRFHVAKHLGDAVNDVRKEEHRALSGERDDRLKGTRYLWLRNPENMSGRQREQFETLRGQALKVARAWAIKELARSLWKRTSRGWARRRWKKWLSWATRCRLEPMKRAAKTVKRHLFGILNSIALGRTNAGAESINAGIQRIKKLSCGFRNRERFRNAIYFHLGGLDLKPRLQAHTNS